MKKKEIIQKLTKENKENISFVNNYEELKDSLNITEEKVQQKSPVNIFKYLTASLAVFVVLLTGLLIYSFTTSNQQNPPIYFPEGPTEEQSKNIHQQFKDLNAKYIEAPIRNFVVDDTLVQLYFGMVDSDTIVLLLRDETEKLNHFLLNDNNIINNTGIVDESLDFEGDSLLVFDFYQYNTPVTLAKEDCYYIYLTLSSSKSERIDISSYVKYLEDK